MYTIAEECERLFCETLRSTFLSEKDVDGQDSLAMGASQRRNTTLQKSITAAAGVQEWLEVWDYTSDIGFRGFIASCAGESSMFVFFDPEIIPKELKSR
jgi:hypothetical protein